MDLRDSPPWLRQEATNLQISVEWPHKTRCSNKMLSSNSRWIHLYQIIDLLEKHMLVSKTKWMDNFNSKLQPVVSKHLKLWIMAWNNNNNKLRWVQDQWVVTKVINFNNSSSKKTTFNRCSKIEYSSNSKCKFHNRWWSINSLLVNNLVTVAVWLVHQVTIHHNN